MFSGITANILTVNPLLWLLSHCGDDSRVDKPFMLDGLAIATDGAMLVWRDDLTVKASDVAAKVIDSSRKFVTDAIAVSCRDISRIEWPACVTCGGTGWSRKNEACFECGKADDIPAVCNGCRVLHCGRRYATHYVRDMLTIAGVRIGTMPIRTNKKESHPAIVFKFQRGGGLFLPSDLKDQADKTLGHLETTMDEGA